MLKQETPDAILIDCGLLYRTSMNAKEKNILTNMMGKFNYLIRCYGDSIDGLAQSFNLPKHSSYKVFVKNISESEDEQLIETNCETDFYNNFTDYDLVIMGGGGFIKPEIVERGSTLFAFPGTFGSHVLVLDLSFNQDMELISYDWRAMQTKGVTPDSAMQSEINTYYEIVKLTGETN